MGSLIRVKIGNKLKDVALALNSPLTQFWPEAGQRVPWCVRYIPVAKRRRPQQSHVGVSFKNLQVAGVLAPAKWNEINAWAKTTANEFEPDALIKNVEANSTGLTFQIDEQALIKDCLCGITERPMTYGFDSNLHQYTPNNDGNIIESQKQMVVVEYSSPNIAKPFHAGHLRSTIIGNVLSNILHNLGHNVKRINFFGNWGTQFGLLGVGYKRYGSEVELRNNCLQHMFDVYVRVNEEAKHDDSIKEEARLFFTNMEQGDEEALSLWKTCMDSSLKEYSQMYKRLGVKFDVFHGEAMYVEKAHNLVNSLRSQGLLQTDSKTGVGFVDLTPGVDGNKSIYANLVRSDGATLYITRDIAAAMHRQEIYKFDRHLYVVENAQREHFHQLLLTLQLLGHSWANQPLENFHISFGRVSGMSTRQGQVVFLRDILDEARARMMETMKSKQTTKVGAGDLEDVAEVLASSAIIVQDLKQRRNQTYEFSWSRMMTFRGDTGISLQYTHARLCSIERNCGVELDSSCDFESLQEPSAINLVQHLCRYDEVIQAAALELEPCHIVQYLFMLSRLVNVASEELIVKGQPQPLAQARLLLFHCARRVLASGLETLGIKPLEAL